MIPTGFSSLQIGCNLKSNLECVLLHVQLLNHASSLAHILHTQTLTRVHPHRHPPTHTQTLSHTHKPNQTLRFISPETVVLFPSTTFNLSIRLFFNHSLLPAVILCVGACAAVAGTAAATAIVLHIFHCNSSSESKTFAQMHFRIKWKKISL